MVAAASATVTTGSTSIQPTVGRVLYGFLRTPVNERDGPFPCIILSSKEVAGITLVTVTKLDRTGTVTWIDVPLYDAEQGTQMKLTRWCEWMPYHMELERTKRVEEAELTKELCKEMLNSL